MSWQLRCQDLYKVFYSLGGGLRQSATYQEVSLLLCFVPPLQEQKQIAAFLDRETSKIDTLIEKQQQLINLLKEKRGSLISHTVTKGLNPNVPMKDSGVEWIGDIPEHWDVKRLKHHGRIFNGRDYKDHESPTGKYPVYGSGGEFTRSDDFLCALPSLLLGRKGTVNRPLIVSDPFWTVDTMYYCVPISTTNLSWLYYYATRIPFDQLTYGSALPSMSQSQYYVLPVPSPPLEEQKQIAAFLDQETSKIDTLIEKANQSITLLRERRSSLISTAVTGKIDVRGVA